MLKTACFAALITLIAATAFAEVGGEFQKAEPLGGSDANVWMTDGQKRIHVTTSPPGPQGNPAVGTFVDEYGCWGGDVYGFAWGGKFALEFGNWTRYDNHCNFLTKGSIAMPLPMNHDWMNEIGFAVGTAQFMPDVPDIWFHESVNDGAVQGWVITSGNWFVNPWWNESMTYDAQGVGSNTWMLTYYLPQVYPAPGDYGYQYEACFRKNFGNYFNSMALYFNGDGTMNNGIIVCITTDGSWSAWEEIGGVEWNLIPWSGPEPCLFQDDLGLGCENVWNMIKVSVWDNGYFDIFFNEQYVGSAAAQANFGGHVGLAVYDSDAADHVSCDNMTVSTVPLEWDNIVERTIHDSPVRALRGATSTGR